MPAKSFFRIHSLLIVLFIGGISECPGGEKSVKKNKYDWAPLNMEFIVFPEIQLAGQIFENVPLHFFVSKSSLKPIDSAITLEIETARRKNPIDLTLLPMATELGHLLLHDKEQDAYFSVTILEHDTIVMTKCIPQHSKPPRFHPVLGKGQDVSAFTSKKCSAALLKFPQVRIPLREMPWHIEKCR